MAVAPDGVVDMVEALAGEVLTSLMVHGMDLIAMQPHTLLNLKMN